MDFWDLTKVLARRWYIAVPGLVLTAGSSLWVLQAVEPHYISTAIVQVAPPISRPTTEGEPVLEQRNPWMALGPQSLANTALRTLEQSSVLAALKAGGYSDTFTATLDDYSPTVTFEVTGQSREQAIATTDELIRRFSASIVDLQVGVYGVTEQDLATAKRIDFGNNVEEANANVKRAVVAVGAAGLLLTFGLSVGVDALIARRERRRASGSPGVDVEDLSPRPVPPAASGSAHVPGTVREAQLPALVEARTRALAVPADIGLLDPTPAGSGSNGARLDETDPGASGANSPGREAPIVLPLAYRTPRRSPEDRGDGRR